MPEEEDMRHEMKDKAQAHTRKILDFKILTAT